MVRLLAAYPKVETVSDIQPATISTASLEYVRVRISAKSAGVAVNWTADTVTMAFKSDGSTPVSGDFKATVPETDPTTDPDTYYAKCLVGSGGSITLTAGTYEVWVKIVDSPETPVIRAKGKLVVY